MTTIRPDVALIDLDIILWRLGTKFMNIPEDELKEEMEFWNVSDEVDLVLTLIDLKIRDIANFLELSRWEVFLVGNFPKDGTRCFRYDLMPDYKANRKPKPPIIEELYKRYRDKSEKVGLMNVSYVLDFNDLPLETDDYLAIRALQLKAQGMTPIIVSSDKDMLTIPGLNYNPWAGGDIRVISTKEAKMNHMFQTLVGDPVDNISGCKGIGKKKAQVLLDIANEALESQPMDTWEEYMWTAVAIGFMTQGMTLRDMRLSQQLTFIGDPRNCPSLMIQLKEKIQQ